MQSGLKRVLADKRDLSFHRSFGSVPAPLPLLDYSYDDGKTMPDQNADGLPYGCTGYSQADIAGNEDNSIYKPFYTYQKTCYIEGHPTDQGCDIRNSLKVGQVYGVQRLDETTEEEAKTHGRGKYYSVDKLDGLDWFDSFRTALRNGKRSISVGTIWFPEWHMTGQDGILTSLFVYNGNPNAYPWHNYAIVGEKTINGTPYLIAKTWQGRNFGDSGWCYLSSETFNKAFDIYGTCGFTQPAFSPQDTFTIKITILQFVIMYIGRIIGLTAHA